MTAPEPEPVVPPQPTTGAGASSGLTDPQRYAAILRAEGDSIEEIATQTDSSVEEVESWYRSLPAFTSYYEFRRSTCDEQIGNLDRRAAILVLDLITHDLANGTGEALAQAVLDYSRFKRPPAPPMWRTADAIFDELVEADYAREERNLTGSNLWHAAAEAGTAIPSVPRSRRNVAERLAAERNANDEVNPRTTDRPPEPPQQVHDQTGAQSDI